MDDSKLVSYCLYTLYTLYKWFKNVSSHFGFRDEVRVLRCVEKHLSFWVYLRMDCDGWGVSYFRTM